MVNVMPSPVSHHHTAGLRRGDSWGTKSGGGRAPYPQAVSAAASLKIRMNQHRRALPALTIPKKSHGPWKYSKAQLKAHMMLPEPLPIPKSVLYDYNYKGNHPRRNHINLSKSSRQSSSSGYRSNTNSLLSSLGRSTSTESSMTSSDSGADDLSDDCASEHSEWDSIMFLGAEAATSINQHDYCRVPNFYPDAIPLPSPAVFSRPISPVSSSGSNCSTHLMNESSSSLLNFDDLAQALNQSSSGSSLDSPFDALCLELFNQSSTDFRLKSCALGQLHFQCARCWIKYPSIDLMEKHIGAFHVRSAEGEVFQLDDDNFGTFVQAVWDADLSFGLYAGQVQRHLQVHEQPLAHLNGWAYPVPAAECRFDEFGTEQLVKDDEKNGRRDGGDSGMETDDASSCGDDDASDMSDDSDGDEDTMMRIPEPVNPTTFLASIHRTGQHNRLQPQKSPAAPPGKLPYGTADKPGTGVTRKMLADTMRKINRIIAPKSNKRKAGGPLDEEDYKRLVPKKVRRHPDERTGSVSSSVTTKGLRKCRGIYGITSQDQWCNMCKWKKRCSRFGQLDDEEDGEDDVKDEGEA